MNYFYNAVVTQSERSRVELLEPFDEFEEWHLKCAHYTLITAFSGHCVRLASAVWLQSSSNSDAVNGGDVVNSESLRCSDVDRGTFMTMNGQSSHLSTYANDVPVNDGEIKELASSGVAKSESSEVECDKSPTLQDIKPHLSASDSSLRGHCSHWKVAKLTFIGKDPDRRCQRFGHTVNKLLINGLHYAVAVGGFGVASCCRHRRLSDVAAWNLPSMSAETFAADGDWLLPRIHHATVTVGNSVFGNAPALGGISGLLVIGGRHSPTSPAQEHVVSVDFGDTSSTKSVQCRAVECSGDVPDPCWRHTVVHAVIAGMLISFHVTTTAYILASYIYEGLRERTEYIDIFLFSAHHSIVFCFRWSVYWWKGSVRF